MNIKAMPQSLLLDCISLVYKTSPVLMHSRNCFQFCLMFDCDYRLEMLFFHEMKFSDSLVYEHSWLLTLIPGLSSLLTALDGSGWDMIGVTAIMCYVSLLVCHFALSDFNLAPVRRSGTNTACRSIPPVLHNKDQLCHIISVPTKTWKWVCVCGDHQQEAYSLTCSSSGWHRLILPMATVQLPPLHQVVSYISGK